MTNKFIVYIRFYADYIYKIIILPAISIPICFFSLSLSIERKSTIEYLLFKSLENQQPNIDSFNYLIITITPVLVFAFFFGNDFYNDFIISSVYVFIRRRNRSLWYAKRCIILLMQSIFFYFNYFLYMFLFFKFWGLETDFCLIPICLYVVLAFSIYGFICVLIFVILSISLGVSSSFAIVGITNIYFCFQLSYFTNNKFEFLFKINPISNLIPLWHNLPFNLTIIPIYNFSYNFTLIYFGIIAAFCFAIGLLYTIKLDIF